MCNLSNLSHIHQQSVEMKIKYFIFFRHFIARNFKFKPIAGTYLGSENISEPDVVGDTMENAC